jgi:MFS family permease
MNAVQEGTTSILTPYVYSAFEQHSLLSTANIIASLISGLSQLALAKVIDIWGRPQGFLLMTILLTLGLVMMAACNNVETYAAAQVFYWVGYSNLAYIISIFVADTSALKNRGLMLAYVSSPFIITIWVSSPFANTLIYGIGWRWGFGIFAIVMPAMCIPLWFLFDHHQRRAERAGLLPERQPTGKNLWQSLAHYLVEFDVVGLLLITAGLALFLLPFSIVTSQAQGWRSPLIMALLVVGAVLVCAFVAWERLFAPVQFMPWELLSDRTVLGACLLAMSLYVEFYIWDIYFSSFLQVALDMPVRRVGYVTQIYSIGSCAWSLVVGAWIRYTGHFKGVALWFGLPVTVLGVGLMIHFRSAGVDVGYVVMCQIFIAVAGGCLVICEQLAVMAAASHQHVAVVLAIEGMFASVGGAIGQTVCGAIWDHVLPASLAKYLPEADQGLVAAITGSITTQLGYPVGSPVRTAINRAYSDAMKWEAIASTLVLIVAVPAVLMWRNINVKDFKQAKGLVV